MTDDLATHVASTHAGAVMQKLCAALIDAFEACSSDAQARPLTPNQQARILSTVMFHMDGLTDYLASLTRIDAKLATYGPEAARDALRRRLDEQGDA